MKALVYTGPKSLDYRNAPDPDPGDGEVIVKVEGLGELRNPCVAG